MVSVLVRVRAQFGEQQGQRAEDDQHGEHDPGAAEADGCLRLGGG